MLKEAKNEVFDHLKPGAPSKESHITEQNETKSKSGEN